MKTWNPKSLYPYWEIPKNKLLKTVNKDLRKAGNLAEVVFWKNFKVKNKLGYDIDRQVIIGNFIVDFFIPELGLVFEIDGGIHLSKKYLDKERDNYMEGLQLKVVRISDVDVLKNIKKVREIVIKSIKEREQELPQKFPS